ncbi:uncharacterized protein LOC102912278 [Peromyscus maniculatus bairdii]|uniref:uncharacterized protein LOC114684629 n=1 Tax=Peromyscus leucopus TaxID=10041 RepID=UPI001884E16E|nr:uncharacterized protein LOC114684629 [Peromyscus leucopus]
MGLRTLRPSWEGGAGIPRSKARLWGDPHAACTPSLAAVAGDGGGEAAERADHGQLRRGPVSRASQPGSRNVAGCSSQKIPGGRGPFNRRLTDGAEWPMRISVRAGRRQGPAFTSRGRGRAGGELRAGLMAQQPISVRRAAAWMEAEPGRG